MMRLKGNRSKASGGQSMDVDLSQDVFDQDLTDLTSTDTSHMMCDPDILDKVCEKIIVNIFVVAIPCKYLVSRLCIWTQLKALSLADCARFQLFQHVWRSV